jgi:hypothetical protein
VAGASNSVRGVWAIGRRANEEVRSTAACKRVGFMRLELCEGQRRRREGGTVRTGWGGAAEAPER